MESPLAQAPSQTCPLADASIDNTTPTSISVNCGIVTGELFPDKLKGVRASNWGSVKCILSNSVWCTPIEFECQGGKPKFRNWRRSIYQGNVQLGAYLSSSSFLLSECNHSQPISRSPSPNPHRSSDFRLIDPVLAFIKAYRLKGDKLGLKQAVLSTFDPTSLSSSHKLLWDFCRDDLQQAGLTYHSRRGSEKRVLTDVLLADTLVAFEKVDAADKLPTIFCEANDLIRLPSLALDSVSLRLDNNSSILETLVKKIQDLPSAMHQTDIKKHCSSLDSLISNLKGQLEQLASSVTSLSQSCNKITKNPSIYPAPPPRSGDSRTISTHSVPVISHDRSNNIILFGLPESSLLNTKTAIEDMTTHLIGRCVKVADAFRLGRRPEHSTQLDARPQPILIRLENCWDKRLLLSSCRKLKGYSSHKLFIREDLPPEARRRKPISSGTIKANPAVANTVTSPSNKVNLICATLPAPPVAPDASPTQDSNRDCASQVKDAVKASKQSS